MDANDRAITTLVMIAHGAVHVYEMAIPLLVVSWLREFHVISLGLATFDVTTATIGVVVTVGYGLFGVGALPAGVFVDRFGSRRLISVCLFGMGASYLVLGMAPNMLVVAVGLILWGITASVYHPAGLSLISNGIEDRGTALAYHGIAGNVGIGLGPLVTAVLLLFMDWRTVALVLGVPAVLAAVYAVRANFDERAAVSDTAGDGGSKGGSDIHSLQQFVGDSRRLFAGAFVFVFVVVMCSGLYYRGVLTFLPELLRGLPGFEPIPIETILPDVLSGQSATGSEARTLNPQDYFYSGLLLIGVVGQYAGGKLTDRITVEYGIAGAFAVLALLALVFVPVSQLGLSYMIVLGAVLGVFLFVVQPMYQALVAEYTTPDNRGLSYGFTYVGVFGIGALGGGLAGAILAYANATALFLTLAAFAAVATALGLYLGRSRAAA